MNLIEKDFANLGRTEKSNFISEHIELATPKAVGEYVRGYLFDVLKSVNDDGYIINYITERGYKVEKKQPNEQLPYVDWNNTGFLNELSVVLVRCYAPKNKFQKELIRLLSVPFDYIPLPKQFHPTRTARHTSASHHSR